MRIREITHTRLETSLIQFLGFGQTKNWANKMKKSRAAKSKLDKKTFTRIVKKVFL